VVWLLVLLDEVVVLLDEVVVLLDEVLVLDEVVVLLVTSPVESLVLDVCVMVSSPVLKVVVVPVTSPYSFTVWV